MSSDVKRESTGRTKDQEQPARQGGGWGGAHDAVEVDEVAGADAGAEVRVAGGPPDALDVVDVVLQVGERPDLEARGVGGGHQGLPKARAAVDGVEVGGAGAGAAPALDVVVAVGQDLGGRRGRRGRDHAPDLEARAVWGAGKGDLVGGTRSSRRPRR